MDREYFFKLGAYDPGLKIWGGENFELSFKVCIQFAASFISNVPGGPKKTRPLYIFPNIQKTTEDK